MSDIQNRFQGERMSRIILRLLLASTGAVAAGSAIADGKAVYDKACAACHATGVANAPKLGDKGAWGARAGAGVDALVATVVKGKGAMPPKAGNAGLSDGDIRSAVEYMLAAAK